MAFAFVRRTANRTGFSTPDKNHLHHRLLRLGHGHRRSVLILWAWTVLLSGFILFPLYISSVNAVIPFGVLALGVVLYTLFHPSLRRQVDPGPEQAGAGPGPAPSTPSAGGTGDPVAAPGAPDRANSTEGAPDHRGCRRPPEARRRSVNGVFPPFCRRGRRSAMMMPVNCRPPAHFGGIDPAGRPTGVGRTTA